MSDNNLFVYYYYFYFFGLRQLVVSYIKVELLVLCDFVDSTVIGHLIMRMNEYFKLLIYSDQGLDPVNPCLFPFPHPSFITSARGEGGGGGGNAVPTGA